ncbi:MAG: lipopolysaccharide heptosyltransferase II [Candidatus Omnitrophica bacterium]|nr:lipopolysaccharide heptosyltransferase II [Candidatus Omnitrophota bacterium]MDD3987453.1 lipopolysaccharide heptosyltransferase II [Candidatus Omnitrophota bacterium]MDD4981254.1 lipopolysaccharide heptosyltransferase II [Candidatus Omnitrophota bacterium]MDD5664668.1 lipopolysaccharide heptosyltransferase II [Candidatus Omnitrophota bacterium]
MNILQILPELNVGGVETGTLDLARQLIRLNHKAVVVSAGGALVKDLEEAGAKHYQLPVHKKSILSMARAVPLLVDIIKKEDIDIVHARSRVPAWIAYFACRRSRAIFITTCHGYYTKHLFSYVMGWGKRVIVLSNIIARHMIEDFSVPHERIRLIPRSVDLDKFQYLSPDKKRGKEFNIGIIGRITPIKGHLYFIKAMAKVARAIPYLKVWIVGDASASRQAYKEEIHVLVRRLGLTHCTEFLGTQKNIPEILSHLDLLILATTTHEAFGRVIIEAQAAGVPVVATEVGGVVDIIENNKNGLLVPPADPVSMAEAAIRIFKDPQLALSLSEAAIARVREKYNIALMVENTLRVYEEASSKFSLLIIKLSSLGDIILSTPALREIRRKFPHHKISLLVGEESKDLLFKCPYIDELLVADFKNRDKGLKGLLGIAGELRKKGFDLVIDLQNNRISHILSFLSLSLNRYGYDNKKLGFLLNYRIKDNKPRIGPIEHQFKVLKLLGIDLKDSHLELWPSKSDEEYIEKLLNTQWLSQEQRVIGINISASKRWATKCWPKEYIIKLCDELGLRNMRVVITGTEDDLPAANMLVNTAKNTKIINACGKTTVNQLAALIKRCAVYISADSSPLHIAAAVNTPVIAFFGPTDPLRHMPPAKDYLLIRKELSCSPCYKAKCKHNKCMNSITVEEVIRGIEKFLK